MVAWNYMEEGRTVTNNHPRMTRERRTVEAMIDIYCLGQHNRSQHTMAGRLCEDCKALREYARQRLDKCPYQEGKTTCTQCPIHCYRPQMRAKIRKVMRYAGPRMVYRHPLTALQHLLDGFRKEPVPLREAEISRTGGAKRART
jgi:hypothetical protein